MVWAHSVLVAHQKVHSYERAVLHLSLFLFCLSVGLGMYNCLL